MKKVIIESKTCYSVSDAAKYLGLKSAMVRLLISEGKLDIAPQRRANSRKTYICADSMVNYKYPRSEDAAKVAKAANQV